MKPKTIAVAFCLILFLCLQSGIAIGQARITNAQLGTGITNQSQIVNPATEFSADTAKIYCAWKAEGLKPGTSLRGVWIAEDVGRAAPANYKIDEAAFKSTVNTATGSFALSKPNNGFPVGKYRLEIYAETTLLKAVPFTVKAK